MIQELSIKDFAIISSLNVSFKEGMTVLTGETGAGKSIIIDAVGLLVGGRGSSDYIRKGAEKCRLEGAFCLPQTTRQELKHILADYGIDSAEDLLVIQRDIYPKGRNTCRVNGQLVNLATLRHIGRYLVDIHGQNEHQELMQSTAHRKLLDRFGDQTFQDLFTEYHYLFNDYQQLTKQIKERQQNDMAFVQRIDMLQFQLEEIDQAELIDGEEEQLKNEKERLLNYQKIVTNLTASHQLLNGNEEIGGVLDQVAESMTLMQQIDHLDDQYQEIAELIQNGYFQLQEASLSLSSMLDTLEADDSRLEVIDNRLAVISQLKRKYGDSIADILTYRERIYQELNAATLDGKDLEELIQKADMRYQKVVALAEQLTDQRKHIAQVLEKRIIHELKELYMENTHFQVSFKLADKLLSSGQDEVVFMIATNVGEDLKPLGKVASGGELSRMMLALKTIFSSTQGLTAIIFDEVDTGVSGRVAQAIAEKIHQVAVASQVLCITHLPQVAAIADAQYFIQKKVNGKRTVTEVRELSQMERVDEIARMISGSEITPLTRKHAQELLALASDD